MKKRYLAVSVLIISLIAPLTVKADSISVGGGDGRKDVMMDTTLTTREISDVPIKAAVATSFTVSLPSKIVLSKVATDEYQFKSVVGVKGDIDAQGIVKVEPSSSVTMYDVTFRLDGKTDPPNSEAEQSAYVHRSPVIGSVTQSAITWNKEELAKTSKEDESVYTYDAESGFHNTALTMKVNGLSTGKWLGVVTFKIQYNSSVGG